jgi:hypothetical protein
MTRRGYYLRLAFSVLIDVLDFTLGRVPIFGTVTDGVGTIVLWAMWGPAGLVNLLEVVDFTDFFDGFVPTATLIALYVGWKHGMFGKGSTNMTARDSAAPGE